MSDETADGQDQIPTTPDEGVLDEPVSPTEMNSDAVEPIEPVDPSGINSDAVEPIEPVIAEPEASRAPGKPSPIRVLGRRFLSLVGLAAVTAVLTGLLDAVSTRFVAGDSDGATVALEGAAISGGNFLLHGWSLSLDSFWSLDAMFNAAVIAVTGLRPGLVTLVPSLIAAVVVVAASLLARDGRRGWLGLIGPVVVLALVGLPSPGLALFFLQGPWHVVTALYCLIAFALLGSGKFDWRFVLAVVLLGIGMNGDLMLLDFGSVAIVGAGLVAILRRRSLRAGASTFLAGVLSVPAALGVRQIDDIFGTFRIVNRNLPITPAEIRFNIGSLVDRVPSLFGVGSVQTVAPGSVGLEAIAREIGLVAVLLAVAIALVSVVVGIVRGTTGFRRIDGEHLEKHKSWRIDDLLVMACGANVVTYLVGAASTNPQYTKYLTPSVIFGSILAGRMATRLVSKLAAQGVSQQTRTNGQLEPSQSQVRKHRRAPVLRRVGVIAVFAVLLVGIGGVTAGAGLQVADEAGLPPAPRPVAVLGSFLEAHHLYKGIGDYWSSSIVTVRTSGRVVIRPVTNGAGDILRRYGRQSPTSWYQGQKFQFLVFNAAVPWRKVDEQTAINSYGKPEKTLRVATYDILIWAHPITVSLMVPKIKTPLELLFSGSTRHYSPYRLLPMPALDRASDNQ